MAIKKAQCPYCHTSYKINDNRTDKTIKCSKCNRVFKLTAFQNNTDGEVCSNCARYICKDEQAHVFGGSVVCLKCDQALRNNPRPRVETKSIEQRGAINQPDRPEKQQSNVVEFKVEPVKLYFCGLLMITGLLLIIFVGSWLVKIIGAAMIAAGIWLGRFDCSRVEFDLDKHIYRKRSTFPLKRCLYEGSMKEFGSVTIWPGLVETDKKKVYRITYRIYLGYRDDRPVLGLDLRAESYKEARDKARALEKRLDLRLPIEIYWSQADFCASPPPGSDLFVCPRCFGKPIRETLPERFTIQYELPGGGAMARETYENPGKTWVCDICKGKAFVSEQTYLNYCI